MPKTLVIVESPAKAKTINKYLGPDYIVEASVGHVKDLPKGGLSIDIEKGFVPTYEIISGKERVVDRLKQLARQCGGVFLATDPDREGEAIAHHIAQEIEGVNRNIRRVLFNEITRGGVTRAMQAPRDIDRRMVEAQEARRVMDRLIGYQVSPFLWKTFAGEQRGLSAGRVQSVALRLVVERERSINSFIPIEYWTLTGRFRTRDGEEFDARLVRFDGTDIRNPSGSAADLDGDPSSHPFITSADVGERLRERALAESYHVRSLQTKEVRRAAPLPFTTSTLQQEASKRLRLNPQKTMKLAQQLYEGVELGKRGRVGLITYMRTDSTRVSDEAVASAHEWIYENFGAEYVPGGGASSESTRSTSPKGAAKGKGGAKVQDAHEAIRPTDLAISPKEARRDMPADLAALYELIFNRFVASQMSAAIFDQTTAEIEGGAFLFRASGRIPRFRGWMQLLSEDEDESKESPEAKGKGRKKGKEGSASDGEGEESETPLPASLRRGLPLDLSKIELRQRQTRPPVRYTESLLIKEMESKGIGRPSTYASIIGTVQDRGYVEQKERRLHATELGMRVCDALVGAFPALFDLRFTARMEGDLDTIAGGNATYLKVLESFYRPLRSALAQAGKSPRRPTYGDQARRRVAASTTPATTDVVRPAAAAAPVGGDEVPACPLCGAPMKLRRTKGGSEFFGCTTFPSCRGTRAKSLGISCPGCGEGEIVTRTGGRYNALFHACSRYPDCRFTSTPRPVNRPCGHCGSTWLIEYLEGEKEGTIECPRCHRPLQEQAPAA